MKPGQTVVTKMPPDQIQKVIFQTLEGHLRAILGTLTVEEVNSDRQSFAQKLTSEAAQDLERMGIGVDVLTVQEISDGVTTRVRFNPAVETGVPGFIPRSS